MQYINTLGKKISTEPKRLVEGMLTTEIPKVDISNRFLLLSFIGYSIVDEDTCSSFVKYLDFQIF